jgi:hypothetical protein
LKNKGKKGLDIRHILFMKKPNIVGLSESKEVHNGFIITYYNLMDDAFIIY